MNAPLRIVQPVEPHDYATGFLDGVEFGHSCADRDLYLYGIITGVVIAVGIVLGVWYFGR